MRNGGELCNLEYIPTKTENAEYLWNTRTRTSRLFWPFKLRNNRFKQALEHERHRSLKALDETETEEGRAGNGVEDSVDIDEAELDGGGSDDEDEFDVGDALEAAQGTGLTFEEAIKEDIDLLDEFLQGLHYQVQFRDQRMLNILEREGAGLFRLARACLHKEKKFKSKRGGKAPSTWEKSTINALFYRTRPADSDVNT
jgi:hypothetical protein